MIKNVKLYEIDYETGKADEFFSFSKLKNIKESNNLEETAFNIINALNSHPHKKLESYMSNKDAESFIKTMKKAKMTSAPMDMICFDSKKERKQKCVQVAHFEIEDSRSQREGK